MLGWSVVFVLSAIVVGFVGFSDLDDRTTSAAQILFWFLLAMGLISAALSTLGRSRDISNNNSESIEN
jgi:uncharacterized membrane protein YtjA (UPF0391 family)